MLTITVDHSAFKSYLDKLHRRLGDLHPVMDAIGMEIESRVSGRFETLTDPNGMAWHPWATSTEKYYPRADTPAPKKRAAKGSGLLKKVKALTDKKRPSGPGNGRLLDRYGDMLHSLTHTADSNSVRIGFGQPYATFHENGTEHMERRGLLMGDPEQGELSKPDEEAVLDVLSDFLQKN